MRVAQTVASAPNRACRATCSSPMRRTVTATAQAAVEAGAIAVSVRTGASHAAGGVIVHAVIGQVESALAQADVTSAHNAAAQASAAKGARLIDAKVVQAEVAGSSAVRVAQDVARLIVARVARDVARLSAVTMQEGVARLSAVKVAQVDRLNAEKAVAALTGDAMAVSARATIAARVARGWVAAKARAAHSLHAVARAEVALVGAQTVRVATGAMVRGAMPATIRAPGAVTHAASAETRATARAVVIRAATVPATATRAVSANAMAMHAVTAHEAEMHAVSPHAMAMHAAMAPAAMHRAVSPMAALRVTRAAQAG